MIIYIHIIYIVIIKDDLPKQLALCFLVEGFPEVMTSSMGQSWNRLEVPRAPGEGTQYGIEKLAIYYSLNYSYT